MIKNKRYMKYFNILVINWDAIVVKKACLLDLTKKNKFIYDI